MDLNHNVFNTKKIFLLLGVAVGIYLCFLLFRGCETHVVESEYKKQIEVLQDQWKSTEHVRDSSQKELKEKDSVLQLENLDLKNKQDVYRQENNDLSFKVTSLTNKLKRAKDDKDTVQYYVFCDSLQVVAENQQGVIQHMQMLEDATYSNYDQQLIVKDSMIQANNTALYQFKKQFTDLSGIAENQYKVNQSLNKKLRREKLFTKTLAGAVLVTGIYAIIKK